MPWNEAQNSATHTGDPMLELHVTNLFPLICKTDARWAAFFES